MGEHSVSTSRAGRRTAAIIAAILAAGAVGGTALAAQPADVAAKKAAKVKGGNGFLLVTIDDGDTVRLQPGKAIKLAAAECLDADRGAGVAAAGVVVIDEAALSVDAVRAAFPDAVTPCEGVVLQSQVAVDADEVEVVA